MKRLVVGTARLSNVQHEEVLRAAFRERIRVIDTASCYGGGTSELILGKVLSELPKKDLQDIEVISKYGYYFDSKTNNLQHSISPGLMQKELKETRKRLGSDISPPVYLIDSPERTLQAYIENQNAAMRKVAEVTATSNSSSVQKSSTLILTDRNLETKPSNDLIKAQHELDNATKSLEIAKSELIENLKECFYHLELEKEQNHIKNYGINSDAFALPETDPLHLDWNLVHHAAREVSNEFSQHKGKKMPVSNEFVLQLPINILEPFGAKVAQNIHVMNETQHSKTECNFPMRVMGTRPLTAVLPLVLNVNNKTAAADGGGMDQEANQRITELLVASSGSSTWQRLIDFHVLDRGIDPLGDGGYMEACQEALEYFNFSLPSNPSVEEEELFEACSWLRQLISDLNQSLVHFVSVAQYEAELNGSIMPLLDAKFTELDQGSAQILTTFLTQYHGMVRYHASTQARKRVMEALLHVGEELELMDDIPQTSDRREEKSLQELALGWAMNRTGVHDTVVGLTDTSHVKFAQDLAREYNF